MYRSRNMMLTIVTWTVLSAAMAMAASGTVATPGGSGTQPGINNPVPPGSAPSSPVPVLLDVTPGNGSTGDMVTIRGKYLSTDKARNEVWFVIASNVPVQATTLNVMKAQDIVSYQVQVPGKAGVAPGYDGQVYMKPKDTGKSTNSLLFHYGVCPPATITSSNPTAARSLTKVTLYGANFKADDEVCFVVPGQPDVSASKQYVSAGQVIVTVPMFNSTLPMVAVYVKGKCGSGCVKGPQYQLALATK